ncbi:MAG: AmmeMemoRadiSam system protein A [Candidatus Marinimicrobia bacterium]|nr:AmmeMemoRadiSam system protein A [Candidatus Neomarinimicrobiota bacterium]
MTEEALKNEMLAAVRQYLHYRLKGGNKPDLSSEDFYREKRGLFVTLHKHGALRGCIGYIEGFKPLADALFEMAESAAFRDPRFPRLPPENFPRWILKYPCSRPLKKVPEYRDIRIGTHGIVLKMGLHQAVFLPQVAPEQNWDLPTTLQQLCLKAGLPADAYKRTECEFYVFTADIFSESS